MNTITCKLLIIGSGPAGYTAGIYASRAMLSPILYTGGQPGGQLTTTTEIENYPGFPNGKNCFELMDDMRRQAEKFGTIVKDGSIVDLDTSVYPFVAKSDMGDMIEASAVIIATGATARYLGLPEEQKYIGMGLSACATCDGFFYRGKDVGVVGGGDTAVEEALYLSELARKVYLIVRRDELRASKIMVERVLNNDKIEVLFKHQVSKLNGENGLESVLLKSESGERLYAMDGLFMAIGRKPNSSIYTSIEKDEQGYILTRGETTQTNVEGVFACGDVCDPVYRQAIVAAASGCKAAKDAERWLNRKAD